MLAGYKTIIGAALLGVTTAIQNLEQSGVLPPGTLETGTGILNGFGWFFAVYGIGDKISRYLGR